MAKKLLSNREQAMYLGIFGGVLMLIAGASGAATWNTIGDAAVEITGSDSVALTFAILVMLASLGGLLVMIGALMFKKRKRVKIGKILIIIGAGCGVLGLIVLAILSLVNGDYFFFTGLDFIGLVLAIFARKKVRG